MLNDNIALKDINVLRTVQHLSSLDISNTAVSDISPLNDLKYIYYVAVKNTKISDSDLSKFEKTNMEVKKENGIDKKLEIITTEASKYFSFKNYIFMLLILIFTVTGIRSYWKKNK